MSASKLNCAFCPGIVIGKLVRLDKNVLNLRKVCLRIESLLIPEYQLL